jgi:hypothetical protein
MTKNEMADIVHDLGTPILLVPVMGVVQDNSTNNLITTILVICGMYDY